jgi:hypothetical protein
LASGPEGRWPERASGPEGKGRQGGIFKALKYYTDVNLFIFVQDFSCPPFLYNLIHFRAYIHP